MLIRNMLWLRELCSFMSKKYKSKEEEKDRQIRQNLLERNEEEGHIFIVYFSSQCMQV